MSYLFWDIYDAKLYTHTGKYQHMTHPIKFSLRYLKDIKKEDIVNATNEQWQHLGKSELISRYSQTLLKLWPDIQKGDTLTLITSDTGESTFYFNTLALGEINDPEFAEQFLAIWLSKHTSQPLLRKQLLGLSDD
ncbi:chalcone isomerase family protein [Pseudoalteromonas sp. MMG010]|uniref:chalcone isomerase family protein n=1 Tax=Pseudoalteromonas sp. MMG010 TaxID=2822685 RepID=UPI001B3A18ED|nr:chalcone isomerase family protein [Pseudoalteromonas sp. MMG010]MBQ4833420.1 chalcone isomerase family protein [Pseudoalteromonas sp. MMG010]